MNQINQTNKTNQIDQTKQTDVGVLDEACLEAFLAAGTLYPEPGLTPFPPLDCGFPLRAVITRGAREEHGLVTGSLVAAVIKAGAVHLVSRSNQLLVDRLSR